MNGLAQYTYVFRPVDKGPWLRYAEGAWVKDDGVTPDLAFVSVHDQCYLGVYFPGRDGILWQWRKVWAGFDMQYDNSWHHYVSDPAKHWGEFHTTVNHPNIIARGEARGYLLDKHIGANGGGPFVHESNPYIDAGKVWRLDTMTVVTPPANPECFLCMDNMKGHLENRRSARANFIASRIQTLTEDLPTARRNLAAMEEELEKLVILKGKCLELVECREQT